MKVQTVDGTHSASTNGHQSIVLDLLAGLRNGRWLQAQTFPAVEWIVPGLIPEGLSLLIGGPKIGKSWLSLNIALAAAAGGWAFVHLPVDPRPVLLLALEDSDRRLQDRIRKLDSEAEFPERLDYLTKIYPGFVVPTVERWVERLDPDDRPPLVILDTVGKVMPPAMPGETNYERDYKIAGRLKEICDGYPGMGLLALHHDRKANSDDFVDSVSGTNGIAGAADTIIVIDRKRNETAALLKMTGRDVEEREYAASFQDSRWRLEGDSLMEAVAAAETIRTTRNLGDRSAEIVRYVNKHPEGVRAADVAREGEISGHEARTYLGRLFDAGKIGKPERGLYTPVASVATVAFDRSVLKRKATVATDATHPDPKKDKGMIRFEDVDELT